MTATIITRDDEGYHTYTGRILYRDEEAIVLAPTTPWGEGCVCLPARRVVAESPVAA